MIELKVEDYCHGCPELVPDVDILQAEDFYANEQVYSTRITCKHNRRCAAIARHIRKQISKEIITNEGDKG